MSSNREIVGIFADREHFSAAVAALLAAGFKREDISVLSSHSSLDVTEAQATSWRDKLLALSGEIKYEGPLLAAGLIALAAGPVGAMVAGLVAAGVGGLAIKEVVDEVGCTAHSDAFTRALNAGSVILWVVVQTPGDEEKATQMLNQNMASNVHLHVR